MNEAIEMRNISEPSVAPCVELAMEPGMQLKAQIDFSLLGMSLGQPARLYVVVNSRNYNKVDVVTVLITQFVKIDDQIMNYI